MIVLNRSWPAVSHCARRAAHKNPAHCTTGQINRLQGRQGRTICSFMTLPSSSTVRIFCGATRRQRVQGSGEAKGESWHRRAHKVHADCGNIALGVRIILREAGRALASRLAEGDRLHERTQH